MPRRDDRPPEQRPGQWTFYRGRWWQFTGTKWVESSAPVEPESGQVDPTLLRYHRDGDGTYWLQHPRTGEWHRHEDGAWVTAPTAPPDLDPEPLAPSRRVPKDDDGEANRRVPRPARWIIALSALVVAGVVALLLVTGGGAKPDASRRATTTTGPTHHVTTVPTGPPTTGVTAASTTVPPTAVTTSTTAATGAPTVRLKASGVANGVTPMFTVGHSWHLEYSFNCKNEGVGLTDNFIVNVNGYGVARDTTDRGVNALGARGSGIQHYTDSGTFNLVVQTGCQWKIRVVEP